MRVWGLGFRDWASGFRVKVLGFRVWGLKFGVWGFGFGVEGWKVRVHDLEFWGSGLPWVVVAIHAREVSIRHGNTYTHLYIT